MKRLILWTACLVLCLALSAAAQAESMIRSFGGKWPDELSESVKSSDAALSLPIKGYLCTENGHAFGAALAQDPTGTMLCAMHNAGGVWHVTASRTAVRQGKLPTLWIQAVAEEWSNEDIARYGCCDAFDVIYDDARYSWIFDSGTWHLRQVTLPVASVIVSGSILQWNDEAVYNTQPITLDAFDEAAFPTGIEEAKQLAQIAGMNDENLAITTCAAYDDPLPGAVLYITPNDESPVIARYFAGVPMEITDRGSGYAKVSCGSMSGWMKMTDLLIGGERAANASDAGADGYVMGMGAVRYQSFYSEIHAEKAAATLEAGLAVRVLCVTDDEEWLQVMLPDGTVGYTEIGAVRRAEGWQLEVMNSNSTKTLNLRAAPDKQAQVLGRYYSGVSVSRLFTGTVNPEWSHVSVRGVIGWMSSEYLVSVTDDSVFDVWPPLAQLSDTLNLRESPTSSSAQLGQYQRGEKAAVLGISGQWAHVSMWDGNSGYLLLEGIGGEPAFSDLSECSMQSACTLTDESGNVIGSLHPGDKVECLGRRPACSWRYLNGAMQLAYPDRVKVLTGQKTGYVPIDAIDVGW